jgi:hypothetical protein
LRFYIDKYQDDWNEHLPALDFVHNSSWHSSLNITPLKVMIGREIRNPLSTDLPEDIEGTPDTQKALATLKATQAVQKLACEAVKKAQQRQEDQANKKRKLVDFYVYNKVFLKKKGFVT